MGQKTHVMHGRDHCPTGADPIPCMLTGPAAVGSYTETILADPDLLAYWPLDDASGDAVDYGPYGMDIPPGGTPTYSQPGPFPDDPALTSVDFGSGDRFFRDASGPLDNPTVDHLPVGATGFTMECWVYPTAFGVLRGIILGASGAYSQVGYQFQVRTGGNVFFNLGDSGPGELDSVVALNLNEWIHIVGTGSTTEPQSLYFNGELIADGNIGQMPLSDVLLNIGYFQTSLGASGNFAGRICQVALYSRALTATEAANHYTAGVGSGSGDFAGQVPISDGAGGVTWGYPTKVDGSRYDGILTGTGLTSTDNGDGTVTIDAAAPTPPSPADDTLVWMPLSTVTGGVPELVWGADDSLIPTLTPLA